MTAVSLSTKISLSQCVCIGIAKPMHHVLHDFIQYIDYFPHAFVYIKYSYVQMFAWIQWYNLNKNTTYRILMLVLVILVLHCLAGLTVAVRGTCSLPMAKACTDVHVRVHTTNWHSIVTVQYAMLAFQNQHPLRTDWPEWINNVGLLAHVCHMYCCRPTAVGCLCSPVLIVYLWCLMRHALFMSTRLPANWPWQLLRVIFVLKWLLILIS